MVLEVLTHLLGELGHPILISEPLTAPDNVVAALLSVIVVQKDGLQLLEYARVTVPGSVVPAQSL